MLEGQPPKSGLPIYRRWWFWVALAILVLILASLWTSVPDQATDVSKPALPVPEGK